MAAVLTPWGAIQRTMKARTRAIIGGIVTCACAVVLAVKVPQIMETAKQTLTGSSPVTDLVVLTCGWWWVVPVAMMGPLVYAARRREPDAVFFKVYYALFTLIMAAMMMLVIAGLLLPLMGGVVGAPEGL
jgi:NADH:ubiquinone oxidoreductase subunit 5 (subunit L)/multisubunit Na+/H+ antiporter MnhA subunit